MTMPVSVNIGQLRGLKDEISQMEQKSKKLLQVSAHETCRMDILHFRISEGRHSNYESLLKLVESMKLRVEKIAQKIDKLIEDLAIFNRAYDEIESSSSDLSNASALNARIEDLDIYVSNLKNTLDSYAGEIKNICHRFKILSKNHDMNLDEDICLLIDERVDKIFQLKKCLLINREELNCKNFRYVFLQAIREANLRDRKTLEPLLKCLGKDLLEYEFLVKYLLKPNGKIFK